MRTISIVSIICIAFLSMTGAAFCADIYYEEWEDGTTAGWQPLNGASTVSWNAAGGIPGGNLGISGESGGSTRIGALTVLPAAIGDYWAKGVGIVKFDVRCEAGTSIQALVRFQTRAAGADGYTAWLHRFAVQGSPEGGWSTVVFNLNPTWGDREAESAGWIQGANAPGFHETMASVHTVSILFIAETSLSAQVDNFRLAPEAPCMEDLPDPVLVFKGKSIAGDFKMRWDFSIENWQEFPAELFLYSPELPPCGRNSGAPRSFIRFVRSGGRVLAEKCSIIEPSQLQDIGFVADLTRPTQIYVEIFDRQCNLVYRSNEVTAEFSNDPPIPMAGDDVTVECSGATTPVTVDGSGSKDPDGDAITYEWYAQGVAFDDPSAAVTVGHFPVGTHLVVLKVSDEFTYKTDVVEITVVDTHAPKIAVTLDRTILWPPNHTYVDVNASIVTEDCDPSTQVALISITCDEAGERAGDSHPVRDASFGTADTEFKLLAERNGNGSGRTYEIIYMAWDSGFRMISDTVHVYVPHDRSDQAVQQSASNAIPACASLDYAYPNPFNPAVNLVFSLPSAGGVELAIYDVSGRIVRRLLSAHKPAGTHETAWNALDDTGAPVPSGVYFVRFQADNTRITRKIVLMK